MLKSRPLRSADHVALLPTDLGTFRLVLLGPEPQGMLAVSLDWKIGKVRRLLVPADDLAAWGDRIVHTCGVEFCLTEPGIRIECLAREWNGDLLLRVERGPFSIMVEVTSSAWTAFGRALQRLARTFPVAFPEAA